MSQSRARRDLVAGGLGTGMGTGMATGILMGMPFKTIFDLFLNDFFCWIVTRGIF